jgi:hypothetical protein
MGAFKAKKSLESIVPASVLPIADRNFHYRMNFSKALLWFFRTSAAACIRCACIGNGENDHDQIHALRVSASGEPKLIVYVQNALGLKS